MVIVSLLKDVDTRTRMAKEAREFVEQNFSYVVAAQAFEDACELAISRADGR